MTTARREAPHHDTLTCYTNYGCRIPECVKRYRDWQRQRERAVARGTWQPFVDAAPVRTHIAALLHAGLTEDRIAALANIPHQSVANFLRHSPARRRGMTQKTSPEIAARVLAIDPAAVTPVKVDATGTHRRIQALAAIGWPYLHIARQLDIGLQTPEQLLRRSRIRIESRQRISNGYELLRNLKPERHGVPKYKAKTARNRAAARRWATPQYWDEHPGAIDDPTFESMYGVTRRKIVAHDANWIMRTTGVGRKDAANRLGVTKSYIDHAFRDHPQYAVDVAA